MTFVGCDLHTRMQQVAVLDTRTGEVSGRQFVHDGLAVEEFHAALPRPVTVGIESTSEVRRLVLRRDAASRARPCTERPL